MSAGHACSHGVTHSLATFDPAFGIGITLNIAFVAVEDFYGWKIDSLALLAEAGHNLSDVIGLVLTWEAVHRLQTAHLVMPHGPSGDALLKNATKQLHEQFLIEHVTIQVVRAPFTPPCATLAPSGVSTAAATPAGHVHPHTH